MSPTERAVGVLDLPAIVRYTHGMTSFLDHLRSPAAAEAWRANDPDRPAREAWTQVKACQQDVANAEVDLAAANEALAEAERVYLDIVDGVDG